MGRRGMGAMARTTLIISLLLCLCFVGCKHKHCVKSHVEKRHQDRWVQMFPMTIGNATQLIPIWHPAYDYEERVCDEYKDCQGC